MKWCKGQVCVCVRSSLLVLLWQTPPSSLVSHCFLCLCFLFILLSFASPKCDGVRWSGCVFISSLISSNSRFGCSTCASLRNTPCCLQRNKQWSLPLRRARCGLILSLLGQNSQRCLKKRDVFEALTQHPSKHENAVLCCEGSSSWQSRCRSGCFTVQLQVQR